VRLTATVLDTPDPKGLALFYSPCSAGRSAATSRSGWPSGRSPVLPVPARPV